MAYTVKQLGELAGISVRTLHYYDEIGLLEPSAIRENGYRTYEHKELVKLQQILFFRELEFPLDEIKAIMSSPDFDAVAALASQRKLLKLKRKRLDGLLRTIDATIISLRKKKHMKDEDLYGSFTKEEMERYAEEAKQRWGNTDAYKQSVERYAQMSKEELAKIQKEGGELLEKIADNMNKKPESAEVRVLIGKHYEGLRAFYEPNPELYRGLAEMYVADPRFAAFYEKVRPGLARFMRDAMIAFCDDMER